MARQGAEAQGRVGEAEACPDIEALDVGARSRMTVQKRKGRHDGWTKDRRATFLAVLAQTCNVVQATRAAGMRDKAAYDLRKRDPAFAALFAEALALGYERLEGALLSHALTGLNAIDIAALPDCAIENAGPTGEMPGVAAPGEVTPNGIALALTLLKQHGATVKGGSRRRPVPRLPSAEETDRILLERLDKIEAKRAREARATGS